MGHVLDDDGVVRAPAVRVQQGVGRDRVFDHARFGDLGRRGLSFSVHGVPGGTATSSTI